jgi:RNA polymerase-binding protein DksA
MPINGCSARTDRPRRAQTLREIRLRAQTHTGVRDADARAMQRHPQIRERLLLRRQQLLARYRDGVARADEELESHESEQVERATEEWDARILSSLGDSDVREIAGIIAAIHRLDRGTYGLCDQCDRRIEPARLAALPAATSCIDCARGHEPAQQVPAAAP